MTRDGARSDAELVQLFQSGRDCEGAFGALYERYGPVTYAFYRRRIGDAELAAEVNHDLWTALLKGLQGFRGEARFKTWLFRAAHHRLSHMRRRWRTHLDERPDDLPETFWEGLELVGAGPGASVRRAELLRFLGVCLARLQEIERAVIKGHYVDEETLREITERLRLTNRSGSRAVLIAAQRKLRRCLESQGVTSAADAGSDS